LAMGRVCLVRTIRNKPLPLDGRRPAPRQYGILSQHEPRVDSKRESNSERRFCIAGWPQVSAPISEGGENAPSAPGLTEEASSRRKKQLKVREKTQKNRRIKRRALYSECCSVCYSTWITWTSRRAPRRIFPNREKRKAYWERLKTTDEQSSHLKLLLQKISSTR